MGAIDKPLRKKNAVSSLTYLSSLSHRSCFYSDALHLSFGQLQLLPDLLSWSLPMQSSHQNDFSRTNPDHVTHSPNPLTVPAQLWGKLMLIKGHSSPLLHGPDPFHSHYTQGMEHSNHTRPFSCLCIDCHGYHHHLGTTLPPAPKSPDGLNDPDNSVTFLSHKSHPTWNETPPSYLHYTLFTLWSRACDVHVPHSNVEARSRYSTRSVINGERGVH